MAITVDVDIDLDDFYDDLMSWEKEELVEKLIKDGYEMKDPDKEYEEDFLEFEGNPLDHAWKAVIKKIDHSRYQLTPEQEELLFNLAKSL